MRSIVIGVNNLCLFDLAIINPKCCHIKARFGWFSRCQLLQAVDEFGNDLLHEHLICEMKKEVPWIFIEILNKWSLQNNTDSQNGFITRGGEWCRIESIGLGVKQAWVGIVALPSIYTFTPPSIPQVNIFQMLCSRNWGTVLRLSLTFFILMKDSKE